MVIDCTVFTTYMNISISINQKPVSNGPTLSLASSHIYIMWQLHPYPHPIPLKWRVSILACGVVCWT